MILSSCCGPVVQLVRTLASQARGRGFEPHPDRHFAALAQSAEHFLGKEEVGGSNPLGSSKNPRTMYGDFYFFNIFL